MKTVLVTGGAGFIGSNLCGELLKRGYRVACVDDFSGDLYDASFKEDHLAPLLANTNFILYRVDICDTNGLKKVFEAEKPAMVAHLAARANVRNAVKDPHSYVDVNLHGTLNVFELAKDYGVETIAFASSGSVYGDNTDLPWREDQAADTPVSPYGATKRAGEMLAYTYNRNFGLNITCLRYFNAYGENNRPDLVPYLWAEAILRDREIEISGDGSRKRDYTYVGDVVRATIAALEKPLGFQVINVGNSNPTSLKELLTVFEKVTGKTAKVKSRPSNSVSTESTYADIAKAKELLSWQPEVGLEDGIGRLVSWFVERRLK